MKDCTTGYFLIATVLVFLTAIVTSNKRRDRTTEQSSSFVGYSQSCWQIGDTLHVVTAKGDTVMLDVSRLED